MANPNEANAENEVTKADVQSTELNRLPGPDAEERLSAEEAAEVFMENAPQGNGGQNQA
ncbi:hypothetical protein [Paenibacillus xerothermodurans]|nr:hypothetical protein [Paenibacillus xerothermodurans]